MMKLPIFLSFICIVSSQQWKSWSANQKYIYTGQLSIDCSALPTQSQYAVTLLSAYINSDTKIYLSLCDLNMPLNSPNLTLLPKVSDRSPSSLTVQIVRDSATTVLRLGISYLIIRWDDQLRKYDYNYLIVTQVDYTQTISSGGYGFSYPLDHQINKSGNIDTFCMVTGFSIISESGLSYFYWNINSDVSSDSTLSINLYFYGSGTLTTIARLSLVVLTFNRYEDYQKAITHNSRVFMQWSNYYSSDIFTFNTFIGLKNVWYILDFQSSVSNGSISLSCPGSNCYTNTYIFQPYYCNYPTPFYQPFSHQCLDNCPNESFFIDQNPYFLCKVKKIAATTIIGSTIIAILILFGAYAIYRERKKLRDNYQQKNQQNQLRMKEGKVKQAGIDSSSIVQIGFVHSQNFA